MRNIVSFNSPDLSLMPFDRRAGNDWCVCGGGWGVGGGETDRKRETGVVVGEVGGGGGRERGNAGVRPRDMIAKTGDFSQTGSHKT